MRSLGVGLLGLREDEARVEVTGGIAEVAFRPTLNGSVPMAYRSTSKLIFALAFTACTLALTPPPTSARRHPLRLLLRWVVASGPACMR